MSIFASSKKTPTANSAISTPKGKASDDPKSRKDAGEAGAAGPGDRQRASRERAATTSTLNPHLMFEGELKYSGKVTLDCEFRGSVITDDTLIVGPSGSIHAEVTAGVIEICGKVYGNIKATRTVKILTGGEVHGNIETPAISMEHGVVFEGACSRPASEPSETPASPVTRGTPRTTTTLVSDSARPGSGTSGDSDEIDFG